MLPEQKQIIATASDPTGERPITLTFHSLSDKLSFGISNYSAKRFARLLESLTVAGYRFRSNGSEVRAGDLLVTFDDGYAHLADVLPPLMQRLQFTPLIFMPTAYIGKRNSWDYGGRWRAMEHLSADSIRELAKLGARFGSHGDQHTDLRQLDSRNLRSQLTRSRDMLESLTSAPVTTISYPFGRYDARVLDIVREAGFVSGYTMAFPSPDDSPLTLGRYPVYGMDTPAMVRQKIGGSLLRGPFRGFATVAGALSYGTVLWRRISPDKAV